MASMFLAAMSAGAQSSPPDLAGVKAGDLRPPLEFRLLSGAKAPTWEAMKGRAVVLDFWATWCAPCVEAIPKMNQLHREFGKDATFVSVTYEPEPHVRQFLKEHPIDAEVGIDDALAAFRRFQAWGIPVVYLFDRQGKLVSAVHPNNLTPAVISAVVRGEVPDVKPATPWSDPRGAEEYFRKNQQELREKYR
jgi:thiol-disulfide isomerase/thioredoxin